MQTRLSSKFIMTALLSSAAFAISSPAMAQQLESEWSPYDDSGSEQIDGYGYGDDQGRDQGRSKSKDKARGKDKVRTSFTPYIEAQQVLVADLKNGGDVLTYSTVAVGADATVDTRNAQAQINVRYERLIAYDDGVDSQDVVTGLARGAVKIAPGLSLEAGGIATRAKLDGRGPSPTNLVGNPDNIAQVYSVYAGPTFATQVGDLSVNAAYRAGYSRVDSKESGILPPGQTPISSFDESTSHSATASVGMQPGALPVGWAIGVGYDREDSGELDQRYEGKYVRGDLTLPVGNGLALVGGIGYEKIEVSERDAIRDGTGAPVVGADGRFSTDPNAPRLIAYQEDGLIWDAGVMWQPSSRTSFVARYGNRYGSDTFSGSFSYQPSRNTAINISAYDTLTGFGNLLNDNLSNLPTQFRNARNPLSGDIGSCSFGAGGGFCLNDALQTASSAAFRARGVTAAISTKLDGWDAGAAVGYGRRTFIASAIGAQATLNNVADQNYFGAVSLGRDLDRSSRFETNVYASYFDPGFANASDVLSVGTNAAYYRQIFRGLSASAAVGLDSYRQEAFDSELTASALLGLRYSF
jgi:hypothetical protein